MQQPVVSGPTMLPPYHSTAYYAVENESLCTCMCMAEHTNLLNHVLSIHTCRLYDNILFIVNNYVIIGIGNVQVDS